MTHHDTDHWLDRLADIARMLDELAEQPITITGYSMDLGGVHSTAEPPLPGGDRLDILGPWASDAHAGPGDQPTPRQVIIEWAHTIHDAHNTIPPRDLGFDDAITYLAQQTTWILESPWARQWCDDITTVHTRLTRLCPPIVDSLHDDTPKPITTTDLWDALHDRPDTPLTRTDVRALGIPAATIRTWRHRGHLGPEPWPASDIIRLHDRLASEAAM